MRWLDRDTVRAPFMALCLDERSYLAAVRHCKITNADPWLDLGRQKACVHTWEKDGMLTCIVCLHPDSRVIAERLMREFVRQTTL